MKIINYTAGAVLIVAATSANATLIGASNGGLWDYDVSTDTSTFIGNTGVMFDIALNPITDRLYGVSSGGTLFEIDKSDASTTPIGSTGATINGLTFSSDGTLYGSGGNSLYTLNLGDGSATSIGSGGYA
ncbi:hypothetical protein [Marinobacter sp. X15-166B]|uniref:hypothetical protein n=1 Tax=Marinobacter sp. X15-166B TaxID=1897620 RepID=UPI00085C8CB8|nr:hypothetical protein [Marinobacter sp. X15-166B]OEY67317.1 hypothetical protein BG841_13280 [Marinobacter sp. X15-166B]